MLAPADHLGTHRLTCPVTTPALNANIRAPQGALSHPEKGNNGTVSTSATETRKTTNPAHFARLNIRFGIARIATFIANPHNQPQARFSSVLFTHADSPIKALADLRHKRLAAVNENAFGGYQLARDALLRDGIDTNSDMQVGWFGFPHSAVVKAVLAGKADVGTVRSGVLEAMVDKGELSMPANAPSARQSQGAGWTIPLSDSRIHSVLKRLKGEANHTKFKAGNATDVIPAKVSGLKDQGVGFQVCANTLRGKKVNYETDLFDVSKADIVPSGVAELARLQAMGYTYTKP